jgi:hypothetical protein
MATLRQAVERARANKLIPQSGTISITSLVRQFHPNPKGSVKNLISVMLATGAKQMPWAVILCRFKGQAPNPAVEAPIERFYRGIFTPGTAGLVEYWRDASLGTISITGSKVFGWVELDLERAKAGIGSGTTRSTTVDAAIRAVTLHDPNALKGFFSQIAVLTTNWAKDGAPPGADWRTQEWNPFWIDGSADGRGKVTLTPPHDGNITAHEMGHGFGMQHDVSADFQTHYADPCCIMSQQHAFFDPVWNANFGPAVCVPHLIQRNWMYANRVFQDGGDWVSNGIAGRLAPVDEPGSNANLAMKLAFTKNSTTSWDYYIQYVRPTNWNQGLFTPTVFIRRIGPGKDIGPTPAILGSISVPGTVGEKTDFVEPSGNIRFQVERLDPEGHIVQVHAARNLLSEVIHAAPGHVLIPR